MTPFSFKQPTEALAFLEQLAADSVGVFLIDATEAETEAADELLALGLMTGRSYRGERLYQLTQSGIALLVGVNLLRQVQAEEKHRSWFMVDPSDAPPAR